MQTVLVTGNTYPVKDAIKALGGRWDAGAKGWRVPADKAAQAQALVTGAPKSAPRAGSNTPRAPRTTCVCCGSRLDAFQVRRGFKFCSSDCASDMKLGGQSGYVNGVWHQGSED